MNYGDADGFVAYHEARGRSIPGTWDSESITAALLSASEWIDSVYGPSFVGHKTAGFTQAREWPRISATIRDTGKWGNYYTYATDAIPDRVISATYEAAFRQATTPGSLDVDYTPNKYKSVTIEGAISVEYASFSSASDIQVQIGAVDKLLWPLLDPSSSGAASNLSGPVGRI